MDKHAVVCINNWIIAFTNVSSRVRVALGDMMIGALAPKEDKTHFFKPHERGKAIEWLLSQK